MGKIELKWESRTDCCWRASHDKYYAEIEHYEPSRSYRWRVIEVDKSGMRGVVKVGYDEDDLTTAQSAAQDALNQFADEIEKARKDES